MNKHTHLLHTFSFICHRGYKVNIVGREKAILHTHKGGLLAHTEVGSRLVVDDAARFATVKMCWPYDEIGNVVRKEALKIETARIALGKHEGLANSPVVINVAEIGAREEAIVATGTEDEPAGVSAPVVKRLGVGGVGLRHRATLSCSEVEQIEVGLMMPNAELPIVRERVTEEATVVRGTGEGHRQMLRCGIDNGFDIVSEATSSGVEIDTAEVITDGVELMVAFRECAGSTEEERTAVGREDGKCLVDGVLLEKGRKDQLVLLDIIDLQVGGFVEDLNAVGVDAMECLLRGVGRIGDIAAGRMPVRIDAETERLWGFGVVGCDGTVSFCEQGGSVFAADMKAHGGRVSSIEAVAVDAALELCVLNEWTLVERRQVALVDAHLAPHLMAGGYETVAEAVVDTVGADEEGDGVIGVPTIFVAGRNGDAERVSTVLVEQLVPVVKVEVDRLVSLAVEDVSVAVCDDSINTRCCLVGQAEVEGSHIHGNGDADIVRIDAWVSGLLLGVADRFCGASHQHHDSRQDM